MSMLSTPSPNVRRAPSTTSPFQLAFKLATCLSLALGGFLSATTGCVPTPADPPVRNGEAADDGEPVAEVTLETASWAEVEQKIAGYAGKVVVVDLWSTSCVPCMKEFPNLVALHDLHGDHVACLSVNLDYVGIKSKPPETYRDKVHEFLTSRNATFDNVLSTDDIDTVTGKVDVASIPVVLVYDREGNLHKRFDNDDQQYGEEGFQYERDIIPVVEGLLNASASE